MRFIKTLLLVGMIMMFNDDGLWVPFVNGTPYLEGKTVGDRCDFGGKSGKVNIRWDEKSGEGAVSLFDIDHCKMRIIELPPLAPQ